MRSGSTDSVRRVGGACGVLTPGYGVRGPGYGMRAPSYGVWGP
ncbi:hypothetical protein CU044_6067 [Streptomyces sp. L-9-10]|nr:hypothetical protein CU044_6067 [Streptomyces sp. L-9-10]